MRETFRSGEVALQQVCATRRIRSPRTSPKTPDWNPTSVRIGRARVVGRILALNGFGRSIFIRNVLFRFEKIRSGPVGGRRGGRERLVRLFRDCGQRSPTLSGDQIKASAAGRLRITKDANELSLPKNVLTTEKPPNSPT